MSDETLKLAQRLRRANPVYRVSYDVAGQLDRHHAMCGPDKPAAIREYNSAVSRGRPRVKLERSYKYETPWEVIDFTAEAPKEPK